MTGQIKLGQVKSDRSSQTFFGHRIFFGPNTFWTRDVLGQKFFGDPT